MSVERQGGRGAAASPSLPRATLRRFSASRGGATGPVLLLALFGAVFLGLTAAVYFGGWTAIAAVAVAVAALIVKKLVPFLIDLLAEGAARDLTEPQRAVLRGAKLRLLRDEPTEPRWDAVADAFRDDDDPENDARLRGLLAGRAATESWRPLEVEVTPPPDTGPVDQWDPAALLPVLPPARRSSGSASRSRPTPAVSSFLTCSTNRSAGWRCRACGRRPPRNGRARATMSPPTPTIPSRDVRTAGSRRRGDGPT